MKHNLRIITSIVIVVVIIFLGSPILADDASAGNRVISLTINWRDDTPATRPESITIELYRHVDDEDVSMDSKTITAKDSTSPDTWRVLFDYYYGPVWEYAFKITTSNPRTALYSYRLEESGNGTNQYTFDFIYGTGKTEMHVETIWEDDNDAAGERPEQLTADLISLETGELERTVTLSGDQDHWQATVKGLDEEPGGYYLVVKDLPDNYSNVVTRGADSDTYVLTNTYEEVETVELTPEQMLSGALSGVSGSIDIEKSNDILRYVFIAAFIILAAVVIGFYLRYRAWKKRK